MSSPIDPTQSTIWQQEGGKTSFTGNMFHVQWIHTNEVNFRHTLNVNNPLNNNLPVKRSRDGQELPTNVGEKLCKMFEEPPPDRGNGFQNKRPPMNNTMMAASAGQPPALQTMPNPFNSGQYPDPMIQQQQQQHPHGVPLHLPLQQAPPHHNTNPLFNMNYNHPQHQPNQQQQALYPPQNQEGGTTTTDNTNNDGHSAANTDDDSKAVNKEEEVVMGFGDEEEEDVNDDNMVGFGFGNDDDEIMTAQATSGP